MSTRSWLLAAAAVLGASAGPAAAQPQATQSSLAPQLQAALDAEGRMLPPNGSCDTAKAPLVGALQRTIAASGAQPEVVRTSLLQVVGDTSCKSMAVEAVLLQIQPLVANDALRPLATVAGGSLVAGMAAPASGGGSDYRGR